VFFSSDNLQLISVKNLYITGFGYAGPDTEEAVSLVGSSGCNDLYKHPDLRDEQ